MSDLADTTARVGLARVLEPGSAVVASALLTRSAPDVWDELLSGRGLPGMGARGREGVAVRLAGYDPRRDLEALASCRARVVCPGDDEWPDERLNWDIDQLGGPSERDLAPPWALFVRGSGQLNRLALSSVSIVGARAATSYGDHMARELAFGVSESAVSVVSGGAYGIDGSAHRAAVAAQGAPTVAVLACGVDVAYPRGHDRLLEQITEQGLLVSEWPPGSTPTRRRFLVRNRVIAALSAGTVVVEAAVRSGSLSTAGRAGELGRRVMAVPGPVTSRMSAGAHLLLRETGATCVTSPADVLEELGQAGEHLFPVPRGPSHPRDGLEEGVRQVLEAVPVREAVGVARIAAAAGVGALAVQQVLPALLFAGLVEQRDGGWRLTALGAGR